MYQHDFGIADVMKLLGMASPEPRAGKSEALMTCPFCGREKKFTVDLVKNTWHCYYCGKDHEIGGGMLHLYAYYRNLADVKSANKEIRERLFGKDNEKNYKRVAVNVKKVDDEPAPIEKRSSAYRALLPLLKLSSMHIQKLRDRGLSDRDIELGLYRSVPYRGFEAIAEILTENGIDLSHVPGFLCRHSGQWTLTNAYSSGIMIPVIDFYGRIEGFQIRFDEPKDPHNKYMWFSTAGRPLGGRTYGWVHIAGRPQKTVYITEGPLKGNVIHALSGMTVISVPGVNSINHLEPTLDYFKSKGTTTIVNAFDMDLFSKKEVQQAFKRMNGVIRSHDLKLQLIKWDNKYKGLDDYLYSRKYQVSPEESSSTAIALKANRR